VPEKLNKKPKDAVHQTKLVGLYLHTKILESTTKRLYLASYKWFWIKVFLKPKHPKVEVYFMRVKSSYGASILGKSKR
jgi:hypothetical protein